MSARRLAVAVCTGLALAAVGMFSLPHAAQAFTGSVHMKVAKVGFIFGVGGGRGVLVLHGHHYPFSVGGVSFGATIGASTTEFVGHASHLNHPSDIAGTYTAFGAGGALAGGAGVVTLQNSNGVVLTLHGRKIGLEASVAISGLTINME